MPLLGGPAACHLASCLAAYPLAPLPADGMPPGAAPSRTMLAGCSTARLRRWRPGMMQWTWPGSSARLCSGCSRSSCMAAAASQKRAASRRRRLTKEETHERPGALAPLCVRCVSCASVCRCAAASASCFPAPFASPCCYMADCIDFIADQPCIAPPAAQVLEKVRGASGSSGITPYLVPARRSTASSAPPCCCCCLPRSQTSRHPKPCVRHSALKAMPLGCSSQIPCKFRAPAGSRAGMPPAPRRHRRAVASANACSPPDSRLPRNGRRALSLFRGATSPLDC